MVTNNSTNGDFSGLSVDQVRLLLEVIATKANIASQICTQHAHDQDDSALGNVFRALESMLCTIGALADKPIGGNCVGDDADWHAGPFFRKLSHETLSPKPS